MLLSFPIILAGLWLYAWACRRGYVRFSISFRSPLSPELAYERYEIAVETLMQRANLREAVSPNDPETLLLYGDSGRSLLAETRSFDTGSANSKGQWEREFDRNGQPTEWYWSYAGAEPYKTGSRFTYAIGPSAYISSYLTALLFSAPRYWLRMRAKGSAKAGKNSTLLQTNSPRTRQPMNSELTSDLMTSLIACASFVFMWGAQYALLVIPIILIHEYGHVLGYRMTGKTGNRMMLVPFFGGIAIAGSDHSSEAERAFCAIMGPAICVPLTITMADIAYFFDNDIGYWAYYAAWICGFMNAANLLPALPLDGGHSLESVLRSIAPSQAGYAMMVVSGAVAMLLIANGYQNFAFIVALWGFPAIMRSFETPVLYRPMSLKAGLGIAAFHLATFALHAGTVLFITSDYFYG